MCDITSQSVYSNMSDNRHKRDFGRYGKSGQNSFNNGMHKEVSDHHNARIERSSPINSMTNSHDVTNSPEGSSISSTVDSFATNSPKTKGRYSGPDSNPNSFHRSNGRMYRSHHMDSYTHRNFHNNRPNRVLQDFMMNQWRKFSVSFKNVDYENYSSGNTTPTYHDKHIHKNNRYHQNYNDHSVPWQKGSQMKKSYQQDHNSSPSISTKVTSSNSSTSPSQSSHNTPTKNQKVNRAPVVAAESIVHSTVSSQKEEMKNDLSWKTSPLDVNVPGSRLNNSNSCSLPESNAVSSTSNAAPTNLNRSTSNVNNSSQTTILKSPPNVGNQSASANSLSALSSGGGSIDKDSVNVVEQFYTPDPPSSPSNNLMWTGDKSLNNVLHSPKESDDKNRQQANFYS